MEVSSLLLLGGLLWKKNSLDVGENTTLSDSDTTEKFVQFFVVPDGELEMPWDDSGFFFVSGSVTSEFEHLSRVVFKNGGEVDGSASSDSFSVVAFVEESVETESPS